MANPSLKTVGFKVNKSFDERKDEIESEIEKARAVNVAIGETNIFDAEGWSKLVECLIVLSKEANKAFGKGSGIEDYFSEEKDYTVYAIRIPTGFDSSSENCIRYSEVVLVSTGLTMTQKFLNSIAAEIMPRNFFRYQQYYEELFSRTVFVLAPRYKGFIRMREPKKHQFFIPILGKDAYARFFVFLADFIQNRLDSLLNSVIEGWKKRKVNHSVWLHYRLLMNLAMHRHGIAKLTQFRASLYYIHIVEEKLERIENKVSDGIVESCRALLAIFKKSLKFADEFLKPIIMNKIGETGYRILEKIFGSYAPHAIDRIKEYWDRIKKQTAAREARSFLESISLAKPINS